MMNMRCPDIQEEIYVFDRRLISGSEGISDTLFKGSDVRRFETGMEITANPKTAPDVASWSTVFQQRAKWADSALEYAANLEIQLRHIREPLQVQMQAVSVALLNLQNHNQLIQRSMERIVEESRLLEGRLQSANENADECLRTLRRIPVLESLYVGRRITLADLVDKKAIQSCRSESKHGRTKFQEHLTVAMAALEDIQKSSEELNDQSESRQSNESVEFRDLLADLSMVAEKIKKDASYVESLTSAKPLDTVERLSQLHVREYLPAIQFVTSDMYQTVVDSIVRGAKISGECLTDLRDLSRLQSRVMQMNSQIRKLEQHLISASRKQQVLLDLRELPVLYANVLQEARRRASWWSKRKSRISADEKAAERSRRVKFSEEVLSRFSRSVTWDQLLTNVDVEPLAPKDMEVSESRFFQLMDTLADVPSFADCVPEIETILSQAGSSTASMRLSAHGYNQMFKSGTLAEHAKTAPSGMFQEPSWNASNAQQDLNPRLEMYQLRIRKLEDLLHQRSYSGTGSPLCSSPIIPSDGRFASAVGTSKAEQQIEELKSRNTLLETALSETADERNALATRLEEGTKTNEDLLANMEAQRHEFILEKNELVAGRAVLEREVGSLRYERSKDEETKTFAQEEHERLRQRAEASTDAFKYECSALKVALATAEQRGSDLAEQVKRKDLATQERGAECSALHERIADLNARHEEWCTDANREKMKSEEKQALILSKVKGILSIAGIHSESDDEMQVFELLEQELQRRISGTDAARHALQTQSSLLESRTLKARDLTQRLYTYNARLRSLLESLSLRIRRRDEHMQIVRINPEDPVADGASEFSIDGVSLLYWMDNGEAEHETYQDFISTITAFDLDEFASAVAARVQESEAMTKKWQREARVYREKTSRAAAEAKDKIAFNRFKEGDLALFLPTRNQQTKPWAAFNILAPHYFLKQQEEHSLTNREWLLARISKVEERVVDLSKATDDEDDNPFELSDGLKWYLLTATEEKVSAGGSGAYPRRKSYTIRSKSTPDILDASLV